jgi:hypothetical protein
MKEQVARKVTLVRAIETADTKQEILSGDDRMYASRSARELAQWSAADSKSELTLDHFLEQRSEQILKRLGERTPAFRSFLHRRPLLSLLSALLPLFALIAGAAIDHIADPHRVDLLSAPLLLIIGWNLLVYVVLLAWLLVPGKRTGWAGPELMRRLSVGKAKLPRKLPAPLASALGQYTIDWTQLSWKLTRARLSRAVHLAAAAFALGAVISLYARGLLTAYAAGWESTFLDANQVHALLSWLFAPVMFLFPLEGFSVADVQALRFVQEPSSAGGARWVHLYAVTLLLLVILPRLILALFAGWRAARLARRFPIDLQQPYYRTLAGHIGAGPAPVTLRVLPYSFTLDERRDRGLAEIAAAMFGEQTRVMLRPSLPYGEDPKAILQDLRPETADAIVTAVLFSLAATPEQENQGALLSALARQLPGGVSVLVDESSLTERAGNQAGFDARVAERIALWRQFCTYHQMPVTVVNLLQPEKYQTGTDNGLAAAGSR